MKIKQIQTDLYSLNYHRSHRLREECSKEAQKRRRRVNALYMVANYNATAFLTLVLMKDTIISKWNVPSPDFPSALKWWIGSLGWSRTALSETFLIDWKLSYHLFILLLLKCARHSKRCKNQFANQVFCRENIGRVSQNLLLGCGVVLILF